MTVKNLLIMTTIVGLLLAIFIFIVVGIGLHYNPELASEYRKWMSLVPVSLLPIPLLAVSNYLQNAFGKSLLIIAVLMGICWGGVGLWSMINDPGDALGYVTGVIYSTLIILTALKIRKKGLHEDFE